MKTHSRVPDSFRPSEITSLNVLFARLMWAAIGPVVLLFLAYGIVSGRTGWLTVLDACYAAVLLLMIGGRWRELRSGAATTITGEPATVEHFRRYVLTLVALAVAVWVFANAIGNHLLR